MFRTIAAAIAGGALALTLSATVSPDAPTCFEDQAITWTGDAHTQCTNLDDLEGR